MHVRLFCLTLLLMIAACTRAGALPDGAYLRTEFSGGSLSNRLYVFRNGQVAGNAAGDLLDFDFAAHARAMPNWSGRYTRTGDSLKVEWADGSVNEGVIRVDSSGKGFDFQSAPYAPIEAIGDAGRVNGRYVGGASYGGVTSAFDIEFDGAGGFESSNAASIVSRSGASEVSGGSSGADSGTYRIDGNRLVLTGSAGTRNFQIFQVPTSGDGPIDMLIVDGTVLIRQ